MGSSPPSSSSSLIRLLFLLTISISSLHSTSGLKCFVCHETSGVPERWDGLKFYSFMSQIGAPPPGPNTRTDSKPNVRDTCLPQRQGNFTFPEESAGPDALCAMSTTELCLDGTPVKTIERRLLKKSGVDTPMKVGCVSMTDEASQKFEEHTLSNRRRSTCVCDKDLCNGQDAKSGDAMECQSQGNGGNPKRNDSLGGGSPPGFLSSFGMIQLGFLGAVVGWIL